MLVLQGKLWYKNLKMPVTQNVVFAFRVRNPWHRLKQMKLVIPTSPGPEPASQSWVGKSSTFLIFSSKFDKFFLFFLKLYLCPSSSWPSGWASRPPGKALATPLYKSQIHEIFWKCIIFEIIGFDRFSIHAYFVNKHFSRSKTETTFPKVCINHFYFLPGKPFPLLEVNV